MKFESDPLFRQWRVFFGVELVKFSSRLCWIFNEIFSTKNWIVCFLNCVMSLMRFINIWKNINSFSSSMNHNKNYTRFINWDTLKFPHIFHLKQKKSSTLSQSIHFSQARALWFPNVRTTSMTNVDCIGGRSKTTWTRWGRGVGGQKTPSKNADYCPHPGWKISTWR